jgi:hypothetical protein
VYRSRGARHGTCHSPEEPRRVGLTCVTAKEADRFHDARAGGGPADKASTREAEKVVHRGIYIVSRGRELVRGGLGWYVSFERLEGNLSVIRGSYPSPRSFGEASSDEVGLLHI